MTKSGMIDLFRYILLMFNIVQKILIKKNVNFISAIDT